MLGRLGRRALARDDDLSAEEAMSEGPATVRPSMLLHRLRRRMQDRQLTSYLVTTSDGKLVGLVRREAAEAAFADPTDSNGGSGG